MTTKRNGGAGHKPARIIRPHKNGRTRRAPGARLTEQELAALESELAEWHISFADWIAAHLQTGLPPA